MQNTPHKFNEEKTIAELIFEFESMSHNGAIGFFEKSEFIQLLNYYKRKNCYDKAITVANHAMEQHPFSSEFSIKKARLFILKEEPAKALKLLDKAATFSPGDLDISIARAKALAAMGFHDGAFSLLNDLKISYGKSSYDKIYIAEAMICKGQKNYEQMFNVLRKALLFNCKNKTALNRIWYCIDLAGKYEESVELHERILDEDPYSYIAWYNLGHSYNATCQFIEAMDAFEYAYIINSKFESAYRDCADTCIMLEQYERAIEVYEDASEHFEPDSDILMKLGQCYDGLKEYYKAEPYYFQAIDLDPDIAEIYFHLGESYGMRDDWKIAVQVFHKAVALDDRNEDYVAALAKAYWKANDFENAWKYYEKSVETAPEQSIYWIQFARFLASIDKEDEAFSILDEANLYVTGTELLYCRVSCLLILGKRKKALHLLGEALHENYFKHWDLLEWDSLLRDDSEIMDIIKSYRKY